MTREAPPAPPRIPDYELLREIGRGSYGVVWLARGVTGLYRAVKIVWRAAFEDPQPYEREFRGIKQFAAVSLIEPRQLALLHVGRNDEVGFFYYVMELADDAVAGREVDPAKYVPHTLREMRARRGRIPSDETLALAVDLAGALAGLHAHKLVHRDIKPSNVIFVGGVPKLADMGLVTSAAATDVTISRVGNAGYMPPDMPGTASADVYALGKVLYELATARERDDFPRLPADLDTLPDRKALLELNEILTRACAPNPAKRYGDASALLDDLRLLQAGKSVRRLRAAERHLARALRVAGILGAAAILAGAGAWIAQQKAARETHLRAAAERERDSIARKSVYAATLGRAQRALETDEPGLARRLLHTLVPRPGETDLRNFEWHLLWREAQADPAQVAHAGEIIKRIALSPDESLIAGQVGDSRTVIWDANSLSVVSTVLGTRLIGGFSADSKWLIGTDRSMGFQRWRVATGLTEGRPAAGIYFPARPLGTDQVLGASYGPSGQAVGLSVWDFTQEREHITLPLTVPDPERWLFMPYPATNQDGSRCAIAIRHTPSSGFGWRLQVYDVRARELVCEPTPAVRTTALGLSNDGRLLAVAAADRGTVQVHDLEKRVVRWEQPARMSFVRSLAFSADATRLLVGGDGPGLGLFDAADGRLAGDFRGHDVGVEAAIWLRDGSGFFSADTAGDLRRWSAVPPSRTVTTLRPGYWNEKWIDMLQTRSVCVSPDGNWFAASESDNVLLLAPVDGASPARRVEGGFPLAFSPNHARLLAVSKNGVVREFDLPSGRVARETALLPPDAAAINFASLSLQHDKLVASSQTGDLWVWRYSTNELIAQSDWKQASVWSTLSRSGRYVAFGNRRNVVRVCATDTGSVVGEVTGGGSRRGVFGGAISPDDRWVALCLETGDIEIRNLPSLDVVRRMRTDSTTLYCVLFSPDGTRLFCGGANGSVQVYATEDWRLIATLRTPSSPEYRDTTFLALGVNERGTLLAGHRADGTIRLWNAAPALLPRISR